MLSLPGDGLVSGEWKISGVPAFEPADGRFAGYRGVAMRDLPPPSAQPSVASELLADPDSLRELVHEIKTPLNAIIGFAEIIDGQYLGPADRRYRERAGEIVAQARLLLGAIDDLDFAAKIHSVTEQRGRRADLGEQLDSLAVSLRELAQKRGVELEFARGPRMSPCAIEPELADRLLYRLCLALVENSASGERLRLSLEQAGDYCRFSISRPAALRNVGDEQLFDPRPAAPGEDPGAWRRLRAEAGAGARADRRRRPRHVARRDHLAGPARLTWRLAAACLSRAAPVRACSSTVEPAAHNG